MNELKVFENPAFGQVRTIELDGEPWFVGKDVAERLGYADPNKAIAMHVDEDDKLNDKTASSLGQRGGWLINESGLYSLVLSSKLETAKDFKRWITKEVIPSIRRHGAYMTPETLQAAILNPDVMMQLCQQLKDAQEKNNILRLENSQLSVENAIMQPKASYFDDLVERNTLTNFRETAKQLHIPPKKLIARLLELKYVYRDKKSKLLPYEAKNKGLFEVKECFNEKTQWSGTQTLVTPKGRETFRLLCQDLMTE